MPARLHVLLIEDSTGDLALAQEVFSLHQDRVQLTTLTTGEAALAALHDPQMSRPDVILSDLHLPGISGLELLSQVKADPALTAIPVVLMSGDADPSFVTSAYRNRASAFLDKGQRFAQQLTAFLLFWLQASVPSAAAQDDLNDTALA
ncbi:response regulator [Deinococcus navajonensis]|uniref:Response regulator n=1 Tax=Deinococcus navajonensis TaxID=309884 RepID=A0ABV8XL62_9DEIO